MNSLKQCWGRAKTLGSVGIPEHNYVSFFGPDCVCFFLRFFLKFKTCFFCIKSFDTEKKCLSFSPPGGQENIFVVD